MNRLRRLSLLLLPVIAIAGGCASGRAVPGAGSRHPVVLISIDGLRPDFYAPVSGPGGFEAPTLQALASQGATASGAEPVYPSVTYPNHASIVTGLRSARHGILSNTLFSADPGKPPRWYWETSLLRAPATLWSQAQAEGLHVAILTWPVSVGAKVDWLVPEIFVSDPSSKESAWDLVTSRMTPSLLREIAGTGHRKVLDNAFQRDQWVVDASQKVLRAHRPDLALIHLIQLDQAEHETGRDSARTRAALKSVDQELARLLEAVDLSRTVVVVLGDHGFYDYDKVVNINTLFARQGWLRERAGHVAPDWKVTAQSSGGTAAVYVRDPKLRGPAIALLKKHAGGMYRVISREELDRLGAFPGAICAVDPVTSVRGPDGRALPGYSIGEEPGGELLVTLGRVRGNHGPRPTDPRLHTGLIVAGPGVPAGKQLGQVSLLDVAPTVARMLGIAMPQGEGHALELSSP